MIFLKIFLFFLTIPLDLVFLIWGLIIYIFPGGELLGTRNLARKLITFPLTRKVGEM